MAGLDHSMTCETQEGSFLKPVHKARRRAASAFAVLTATLAMPASPAAADTPAPRAHSYILPADTPVPSLNELRSEVGQKKLDAAAREAATPRLPMETVGPDSIYRAKSRTPSVIAPPTAPSMKGFIKGATYPDPPRTITLDECKKNIGSNNRAYFKSRFAVCMGFKLLQIYSSDKGTPIGSSWTWLYIRGSVPENNSRTVQFDYDFTDFTRVGKTQTDLLKYKIEYAMSGIEPAGASVSNGGNMPQAPTSFDALAGMRPAHFLHTVTVASGQGQGLDDLVYGVYNPRIKAILPPYNIGDGELPFALPPRWDTAKYINPKGGAAFSFMPTLPYSADDSALERGVARHIRDAYERPHSTKPDFLGKTIPGRLPSHPLHRLYHNKDRKNKNRSTAIATCVRYFGEDYAKDSDGTGKKDCDEFPFATSYEGAAQAEFNSDAKRDNYSALPLNNRENRAAGIILGQFLKKNRVVDGWKDLKEGTKEYDGYMVDIVDRKVDYETQLINKNSNKCLEIDGSSTQNGARAQQWECKGQPGAEWVLKPDPGGLFWNIVNQNSGKCLEVADSRVDNGAPVQQWDCAGNQTQKWDRLWTRGDEKVFRNANSGNVLEIDNSSTSNGALAQQWQNSGQPSAYWIEGSDGDDGDIEED
ncbi:hypothetical protein FGW37_30020 [Streptomyces rectiverticillatus]|uniref:RICIN domain-containing protein n=1 Tax=Streptomyces rectiverticillatus TaxID=173860 RepID=UPI0015C3865E|nr:RICIN domain-containing protein [Streptomyces rectiverticillatus]QLE75267.1 hypothetical protein FGW37_30020 [Streptomyces rectiverticillatus]